MPKTSVDLFNLIKSLNRNEKGYIKKFAMRNSVNAENNNYLRLFDAIDRQEVYDEKELLKTEKYITQLPKLKNYLYENIMKGLDSYNSEKSTEIQLRKTLNSVEILYDKALYAQCRKLLAKAKNIASKNKLYAHLIEILRWQKKIIMVAELAQATSEATLEAIFEEEKQILDILEKEED